MNELERMARRFRALADPNRLAILQLLRERCCVRCGPGPEEGDRTTVSSIAERFDLALSTVSHHLKELREAGLIRCVKRGQCVYCTPDPAALELLENFLKPLTSPE